MKDRDLHLLSTITDQLPDAIIVTNLAYEITYVNRAFEGLYGYSKKEILGQTPDILNVEPDFEKIQEDIYQTVSSGRVWRGEILNRRKDGSTFACEAVIFPLKDEQGNIYAYIGNQRDITEAKKIAKALKDKTEDLQKNSSFLSSLVESPSDVIIAAFDRDLKYTFFNTSHAKEMKKVWGVDIELGIKLLDYIPGHDQREQVRRNFEHVLKGGKLLVEERYGEGTNGFWYQLAYHPILKPSGEVEGVVVFIVDITERKRSEEALRKAKKEIDIWNGELENRVRLKSEELEKSQEQLIQAEKLSAIGQLSAGLAHELNSPLAGLLPLVEKYREKAKNDKTAYQEFSLMYNACLHMASIVKDFTLFSRKSSSTFTAVNVNSMIEDTLGLCSKEMESRGIRIARQYSNEPLDINGEKTGLQQVVLNILTNAGDAMPDGGALIIKTDLADDGRRILMEFKDSGTGIMKQDIKKIFEPFYTTKSDAGRVGLGLSVSQGIIEKHGGDILVESMPKKGTSVKLFLPAIFPQETK